LVSGLAFTDAQAGQVAAVNTYGAAFGAAVSIFTIARFDWRKTSILCLVILVAIDLLSILSTTPMTMIGIRTLHGLVGGLLIGTGMGVIGRTANPDRSFGMLLFVQFGLGGLGVMFLPRLVPLYGVAPLFLSLAVFSLVTLCMMPFLPDYPPRSVAAPIKKAGTVQWTPLVLAISALFLFQAANMGLLAYIFRLGTESGLSRDMTSGALGLATWVALAGPLLVMVLGRRFGRFPLLLAGMLLTLGGNALFHWSQFGEVYLLANCATGITWGLVVPYLFGMTAEFDGTGRTAAAASVISKLGLASGPLVASMMLGGGAGFAELINTALAALVLAMLLMLPPAIMLDRSARRPSELLPQGKVTA
jgi:MFS family permease